MNDRPVLLLSSLTSLGTLQGPFTPVELLKLQRVGAAAADTAVRHPRRGEMPLERVGPGQGWLP